MLPVPKSTLSRQRMRGQPISRILSRRPSLHGWPFILTTRCLAVRAAYPGPLAEATMRHQSRRTPIWHCSKWGLPCRCRCRQRGGLLLLRFTLAPLARRFVFCGAFPRVSPAGRYPALSLRGVRTFLARFKRARPSGCPRRRKIVFDRSAVNICRALVFGSKLFLGMLVLLRSIRSEVFECLECEGAARQSDLFGPRAAPPERRRINTREQIWFTPRALELLRQIFEGISPRNLQRNSYPVGPGNMGDFDKFGIVPKKICASPEKSRKPASSQRRREFHFLAAKAFCGLGRRSVSSLR